MWDVAGLTAPRHLLIVNGREDNGRCGSSVDRGAEHVRRIYETAGAGDRFDMKYGHAGHRFYKDLMWPFVRDAMAALASARAERRAPSLLPVPGLGREEMCLCLRLACLPCVLGNAVNLPRSCRLLPRSCLGLL